MERSTVGGKTGLRHTSLKSDGSREFLAFAGLVEAVFGMPPEPPWPAVALFEPNGRCVAGLQHALLRLSCEGVGQPAGALRNVCVAPDRRGLGLMRRLVDRALAVEAAAPLTLLYAEEPALYAGFGFVPVAQHAFEGPAPAPEGPADMSATPPDEALVRRLVAARSPLSARCDLVDDGGLRLSRLLAPDAARMRFLPALDALVVVERDRDTLVLVDIVAPRIPSAARLLGALGERPTRLRTLFPPDQLGWTGLAVAEDAGLMARGPLPPAMRLSFMLPPTVEF